MVVDAASGIDPAEAHGPRDGAPRIPASTIDATSPDMPEARVVIGSR